MRIYAVWPLNNGDAADLERLANELRAMLTLADCEQLARPLTIEKIRYAGARFARQNVWPIIARNAGLCGGGTMRVIGTPVETQLSRWCKTG